MLRSCRTGHYAETLEEELPKTFLYRDPEWVAEQVAKGIALRAKRGQVRVNKDGSYTKRPMPSPEPDF